MVLPKTAETPLCLHKTFLSACPYVLFLQNMSKCSKTCKRTKMSGAEREECLQFFMEPYLFEQEFTTFRITVTDSKHWVGCVGFSSFVAKKKCFVSFEPLTR